MRVPQGLGGEGSFGGGVGGKDDISHTPRLLPHMRGSNGVLQPCSLGQQRPGMQKQQQQ